MADYTRPLKEQLEEVAQTLVGHSSYVVDAGQPVDPKQLDVVQVRPNGDEVVRLKPDFVNNTLEAEVQETRKLTNGQIRMGVPLNDTAADQGLRTIAKAVISHEDSASQTPTQEAQHANDEAMRNLLPNGLWLSSDISGGYVSKSTHELGSNGKNHDDGGFGEKAAHTLKEGLAQLRADQGLDHDQFSLGSEETAKLAAKAHNEIMNPKLGFQDKMEALGNAVLDTLGLQNPDRPLDTPNTPRSSKDIER